MDMSVVQKSYTFGEAVEALKQGKRVARAGWNGKNMHIYLEHNYAIVVDKRPRDYEPVIVMFNAQGKHQPGWLANQPDILANDWLILD